MTLNLIISLIIFALLIAILALVIFILRDKNFSNAFFAEFSYKYNKTKLKRLANTIKIFVSSLILILFALVIIVAIFGVGL